MNQDIFLLESYNILNEDDGGEPMEGDISVGDDGGEPMEDTGEETEDIGEDMDDDMEDTDDDMDNGMDDDSGGDAGMGDVGNGSEPQSLTGDNAKKRKLMEEYDKLLNRIENLIEITDTILSSSNLDDNTRSLFIHMKDILIENKEKTVKMMGPLYLKLEYKKLLTVFLYIKMTVLNYADILRKFIA